MSKLSHYRQQAQLSQEQLAKRAGCSQPTIHKIEEKASQPSVQRARAIVTALNNAGVTCTLDDVFPADPDTEAAA